MLFGIAFALWMGAGTLLQLEWNFIMPANTLAIFAAKTPVEPSAPTQDKMGDDGKGFKDFMDTAVHKTDTAQKPSKEDSTENQNNTHTQKTQSLKTKKESHLVDDADYQEASVPDNDKPQSRFETINKESLVEDTGVLNAQLQELKGNQAKFDSLMALLGLDVDADIEALQQSLSQTLNLTQKELGKITSSDLINKLQQNKGEAVNLLKQVGFTDSEAKNLLDQFQSLKKTPLQKAFNKDVDLQTKLDSQLRQSVEATTQKVFNKDVDLQTKLDSQLRQSVEATTKNSIVETNQDVNDEAPSLLAQLKNTAKESEKTEPLTKRTKNTDRPASLDKLQDTPIKNEVPRITNQELVSEKGGAASNLSELLSDKNSQATILQTENFSDGKGFKGLETAKIVPDLQIQPPTATVNTTLKAVEANKPILSENLLARGATEAKIINQITDKMTIRSNGSENEVHIKLDPPSLGKVRMNIITSGDTVRTLLVVENHAVKQVIENNFNQLRDSMGEQGLKVDSFTVTVGGESNQQNLSDESSSKEDKPASFEETAEDDTDKNSETETVSLFFDDNQSISVIV
jgi:flagellar hook-length control protein FliK